MPSGAKKRKAAKKKLQKAHNNGAHSQASDDPRSRDDRVSDGDVHNHEEGTSEITSGDENAAKVELEGQKSSSGSSCGSSSDNEEIVVQKEKSVVFESIETEHQDENLNPEAAVHEETPEPVDILAEDNVSSEISKEESVPIEEEVKQIVEEVLPQLDEKEKIPSVSTNLAVEKCDSKSIPIVDITVRENEPLLPASSGEKNGGVDHHVKESEELALISSVSIPVRRTSWMNCCGLFEVFSGGSSR